MAEGVLRPLAMPGSAQAREETCNTLGHLDERFTLEPSRYRFWSRFLAIMSR
jgi:hypothetical protein